MEQTHKAPDWIGAYLEWNGLEPAGSSEIAQDASPTDYPAAYIEWLDAALPAGQAIGGAAQPFGRRASDAISSTHGFREAVLLAAVHAQADCLHILRQVLESGSANVGTIRLAAEALEHAQRLLDDERLAWHALSALHGNGLRRSSDAWHSGMDREWPQALEHVASDVRSLTSTVLALQFH